MGRRRLSDLAIPKVPYHPFRRTPGSTNRSLPGAKPQQSNQSCLLQSLGLQCAENWPRVVAPQKGSRTCGGSMARCDIFRVSLPIRCLAQVWDLAAERVLFRDAPSPPATLSVPSSSSRGRLGSAAPASRARRLSGASASPMWGAYLDGAGEAGGPGGGSGGAPYFTTMCQLEPFLLAAGSADGVLRSGEGGPRQQTA